ncbi:MAG: xanthine dehydrogenase family protein molybdopterin-binding subunit [Actinomycetota bacterium]|nr:xanthine dehydrogenase family protein molybdopterin-binding subunit [Actinomycetota bacterium]
MATVTELEVGRVVGTSVPRKEDLKLLTGQAKFIDDMTLPGMVWMAVVRSPYAHARIASVNVLPALAHSGVVAAFSGEDLAEDWEASLPTAWVPTEDTNHPNHRPLAVDEARYAGDGVAVVVAESREAAQDAAELVEVEYEPLPVVTEAEQALADDAPLVHDEFGTNRCYTWELAAGEVDEEFAKADVTVKERYHHQRLIPNAIEPRGVLVQPVPANGEFTLWSSTQVPHIARVTLSMVTGIPEAKLRVIAPDVGGGFGSKLNVYAEEALGLALARRIGRPVKWIERRTEGYLATIHGRDQTQEIELAATAEGKITAVRAKVTVGLGAYLQLVTAGTPLLGAWLFGGSYDIKAYGFQCTGVFTNTTPTDAYRGAGRPEATYAIERAVDALARKLDKDPVELRRLNFIKEFPATIASGLTIDSGDYDAALDEALELADYDALRREQAERRERGDTKQLGIGLSTYVEMCGLAPSRILGAIRYGAGGWDAATIRILPTGTVQALIGTSPHGQSHVTTFSQIAADRLGIGYDEIEVLHGDTAVQPLGMDTYGSRSLAVGGVAVYHACDRVVEKARKIAAHQLGVSEDELEFSDGTFSAANGDGSVTIKEIALAAWTAHDLPDGLEPGLEATYVHDPENFSWPAGTHIAVVEVDTETGSVDLNRYVAVDDVGRVVNPTIVDGQIHGGVTQGIAQALFEEAVYDEDGTLLTGSMVNYMVPSAAELPSFELGRTETPSPTNPLGVKGVGETGTIASIAAVMNAVIDALTPLGVTELEMPATPERVWRAIREGAK